MGELPLVDGKMLAGDENTDQEDFLDLSALSDSDDFHDCCNPLDWQEEKERNIVNLVNNQDCCDQLRDVCFSRGGLLKDDLRKLVWPMVLSAKKLHIEDVPIESHQYYNQVVLDVRRILKRFPPGIDEVIQADLQIKVTELIIRVLIRTKDLHYYQGFHDVAITLLLVLGDELSYSVLCHLARSHFQLYMQRDMEPAMEVLNLVYILIKSKNQQLYDYLMKAELGTIFCLPWVITWFGHVLNNYSTVVRLFDVFISSHHYSSMYLSAVIILHRADEIFSTPCDMPLLHHMLSNLPDDLPLENLLLESKELMSEFPPETMGKAIRDAHEESLRKAKEEEEERRKRIASWKANRPVPAHHRNPFALWVYYWASLRRPLRSPTVKMVALSVSVATVAWIFNYIRPNIEGF